MRPAGRESFRRSLHTSSGECVQMWAAKNRETVYLGGSTPPILAHPKNREIMFGSIVIVLVLTIMGVFTAFQVIDAIKK